LKNPVASNPSKKPAPAPKSNLPLEYSGGAPGAHDPGEELVRWLFPAYIMLILVGFFVLRVRGVTPAGNELSPDRAVFTAVNAATLTGFQLSHHPTGFETVGKVLLFVLMIAGSMFSLVVGGLAAKRILRFDWPDRRIFVFAAALHGIALLIGLILPTDDQRTTFGGVFRCVAALGNCGLYIDVPPGAAEPTTHVILLPLAVLGGLGITVVIELWDAAVHKRSISRHARVVLGMSAGLYLVGLVGLALLHLLGAWTRLTAPITDASAAGRLLATLLIDASALSLDARTPGLAILPIYNFPRAMTFFLMLLMMVGASPAGTGGGLKTTTIYELFAAPVRALRGRTITRTFGVAATWLGVYLVGVAVFHMMLLSSEPQMPGDRSLFITVSAMSNVGLSHDTLSMTRSSLFVVSAAMFTGRLVPLLILWWMVDTTRDAEVVVG
jgi:trk system potassium uptake protein TrkH